MPKLYRVELSAVQRAELNKRVRARTLAPRLRERLEMVRLSDLGLRVPQIAGTLGAHEQTVRKFIKAFLAVGFAGWRTSRFLGARRERVRPTWRH